MSTSIDNILIPIARSYNTQKAVAEATKLAKPWQTTIHLVSLMRPGNPFSSSVRLLPSNECSIMTSIRI